MAKRIVVTARGKKLDFDALKKSNPNAVPVRNFRPATLTNKIISKTAKNVPIAPRKPHVRGTKPAPRSSSMPTTPIDIVKGNIPAEVPMPPKQLITAVQEPIFTDETVSHARKTKVKETNND
jgi:hypothetical protein